MAGDLAHRFVNVAEVGFAARAPGRRADRDENRLGLRHGTREVGGERQPPGRAVVGHQHIEAGLEDRDLPPLQALDLGSVGVDADHLGAEFRKAGPRNQTDIPGADHCDAHFEYSRRT